jgi:hypothetical protein
LVCNASEIGRLPRLFPGETTAFPALPFDFREPATYVGALEMGIE